MAARARRQAPPPGPTDGDDEPAVDKRDTPLQQIAETDVYEQMFWPSDVQVCWTRERASAHNVETGSQFLRVQQHPLCACVCVRGWACVCVFRRWARLSMVW